MTEPRVVLLRRCCLGAATVAVFKAHVGAGGREVALHCSITGGRLTPALATSAARIRDSLLAQLRERGHFVTDHTNLKATHEEDRTTRELGDAEAGEIASAESR